LNRSPIVVLPDELANQIAAGEVVERPASIVKELCENAIDAQASRVDVEVDGGGVARIVVTDDGWGIPHEEISVALVRHATSKLRSAEDLACIRTLGFRGEALPSIASVSRFELASRPRGATEGRRTVASGVEPCGMSPGTKVTVRDLFYNVPARLKFLRSTATESAHVSETVDGVALANPAVSITLTRDGRRVRELLRVETRAERVAQVLSGWELVKCKGELGPLQLEAYLSLPERARLGATGLWLFVNGRPVNDRAVTRAVAHAYGSVLEAGRYPVGVVYLELPPELVDVNVHPQKAEVRFADARAVQGSTHRLIERGLGVALSSRAGFGAVRPAPFERAPDAALPARATFEGSGSRAAPTPLAPGRDGDDGSPPTRGETSASLEGSRPYPTGAGPNPLRVTDAEGAPAPNESMTFLAQLKRMFLLCETEDALVVLDQHAAAERVLFDRLKRSFLERSIAQQVLLVPETFDASSEDLSLVEEHREACLALGVDVRAVGPGRLGVFAVPQLLLRHNPVELAGNLLGELSRRSARDYSHTMDLALATMACHGSLRAGDLVTPDTARELLLALGRVEFAGHCPHGRPILSRVPLRELASKVGR
jgi:DNA mismatch repair protein MutL